MSKLRVLIVENDAVTALNLKRSLEEFGYNVIDVLSSGREAIDKAREKRPDLVLVGSGLEDSGTGSEEVKQIYYQIDIPIVNLMTLCDGAILRKAVEVKMSAELLSISEQRLLTEIQSILFTTEKLISNTNLEDLLDFVATQARHLTNADGVVVLLLSQDKDNLKFVSCSTRDPNIEINSRLPVKGSIAETALTTLKTEITNYPKNSQVRSISKSLARSQVGSLLCAPLKVHDRILGVLLIWSKNRAFFNKRDTQIIHRFAIKAALALRNFDLHIQNREWAIRQERRRLARNLHDSVTQSLYSIGMAAQAALRYADQKQRAKAKRTIELIQVLSQTALAEIRTNLHELYPMTVNEKSLDQALEYYCNSLEKQFNFKVNLSIDSNVKLTGFQVEHLYYIAKEALWNAVKHATTNRAKVVLTKDADNIVLIIEDRGVGFVYPSLDSITSIGLRNIQDRVELLAGSLIIRTKPGWGTQVKVQIPFS